MRYFFASVLFFAQLCFGQGKVLVVLSGVSELPLVRGNPTYPTGFYLPELITPLEGLFKEGYEVDFANPTGEESSMDKGSDKVIYFSSKKEHEAARKLLRELKAKKLTEPGTFSNPIKLKNLDEKGLSKYIGVFIPGGHAPMGDLYRDENLGRILKHFHKEKKPTGAICHAPVALLSARDEDGWIYSGYRMTVFSTPEEKLVEGQAQLGGYLPNLQGFKTPYAAEAMESLGAKMSFAKKLWNPHVVVDRELVTGQNPGSHYAFRDAFVKLLSLP